MSNQSGAFPAHVRAFSILLIKLRHELGNDLDMVLILAVIAERYYAAIERSEDRATDTFARPSAEECGINAHSVALYTEIPRETVRRKIKTLVAKGWLDCDANGNLAPTPGAAKDLAKGTVATVNFMRAATPHRQD